MSDERRYDDEEVDQILRLAAETGDPSPRQAGGSSARGMTLGELQEIGEEVGISKELVARAATALDHGSPLQARTVRRLGVPLGVERLVSLPRTLTDVEWERLVARLRRTFRAQGRVDVMGGLRQWSNGNLQVSLEPGESGPELRMQTHKGSVRPMLAAGAATMSAALALVVISLVFGISIDMMGPAFLGFMGFGVAAVSLAGLPAWASERTRQMEEIGDAVLEWTALPPSDDATAGPEGE